MILVLTLNLNPPLILFLVILSLAPSSGDIMISVHFVFDCRNE